MLKLSIIIFRRSVVMATRRSGRLSSLAGVGLSLALALLPASGMAAEPIRIGEINSYKNQPAFLEPYRQGWQLALEEVNEAGGVLGRPLEVTWRDDNANPGDAVRAAEELRRREGAELLFGG